MANGKQIRRPKSTKIWKILTNTTKTKQKKDVERLICAIQQEMEWDQKDMATWIKIQKGKLDWSGNVRSKRRPRKYIRRRS